MVREEYATNQVVGIVTVDLQKTLLSTFLRATQMA